MGLTPEGLLLQRVLDLDFLLQQPGAAITLDDILVSELAGLRLLESGRDLYQKENDQKGGANAG